MLAALAIWRAEACDGVVALGGGSPIDLAKGVALLATHPGPLEQYAAIYGGLDRIGPPSPRSSPSRPPPAPAPRSAAPRSSPSPTPASSASSART